MVLLSGIEPPTSPLPRVLDVSLVVCSRITPNKNNDLAEALPLPTTQLHTTNGTFPSIKFCAKWLTDVLDVSMLSKQTITNEEVSSYGKSQS